MRVIKMPEPLRQGERATKRKGQYFNQTYSSTARKNFKSKSHSSRRPEQRELDRALLAMVGLRFEPAHAAKGGHYE